MDIKQEMLEYRARNELSMTEAAQLAGVSLQTWMHVERGLQTPTRLTETKIMLLIRKEQR